MIHQYGLLNPTDVLVPVEGGLAYPTMYILDRNGVIHWRYIGKDLADRPDIDLVMQQFTKVIARSIRACLARSTDKACQSTETPLRPPKGRRDRPFRYTERRLSTRTSTSPNTLLSLYLPSRIGSVSFFQRAL